MIHNNFNMSSKKIIRTALDPTPEVVRTAKAGGYDGKKDPTVQKKMAIAEEFIEKYGLPKSFKERRK